MDSPVADLTNDEFIIRYNVGGISINEAAFQKLKQEISLQSFDRSYQTVWETEIVRLYTGMVPLGADAFRRIVLREGHIARIDPRNFSYHGLTGQNYYEVCTTPALYEVAERALEEQHGAAAGSAR
jgi:hypothetical protein